ncbi:MAG: HNH endonuclease signature motif containing protein [Mycobacterium sp.]
MFESKVSSPEVIAGFDELFERRYPSTTPASAGLLAEAGGCARAENRAVAGQLAAIGRLFAYRLSRCAETEDWAVDTEAAVSAEVAAELRISQGLAASRVGYARALRERLPKVGEVFAAGDINFRMVQTLVFRTDLITDADVVADVDAQLAARVGRWPSLTPARLAAQVDKVVAVADADPVRRRRERAAGREVWIGDIGDGLARIEGALFSPDAHALDDRLNALAATVCDHDPRSREQRRADALGALAAGTDRLGCRCGRPDCAAGTRAPAGPVVIHVIAEHATLDGRGTAPGCQLGAAGLIPPELIAELAASAKRVPLVHPGDAPPEPGYVPSQALADFVRCRDLTCRWPGCDCPAVACDIDHTIPYGAGGPTHASNLKCYCRTHHLVKTFWGWQEQQLPDATLILTSPAGRTYVTTPGSALLFPSLCRATGAIAAPEADPPQDYCDQRTAMMPTRRRTRAYDRATRIATERRHNRRARHAPSQASDTARYRPRDATGDGEPPF